MITYALLVAFLLLCESAYLIAEKAFLKHRGDDRFYRLLAATVLLLCALGCVIVLTYRVRT